MEVRVLGPIEVVDGARAIDVGTRMHRVVLSVMVMEIDRVVSLDRIIDCLWGDEPPPTATGALHVYISGLRKVLEPDRAPRSLPRVLVTESPGYALRLPPEAVDVARFEAFVREGQTLLAAGRPASACHVLELGLGLWRGSAFRTSPSSRSCSPRSPGWISCAPPPARRAPRRCSQSAAPTRRWSTSAP